MDTTDNSSAGGAHSSILDCPDSIARAGGYWLLLLFFLSVFFFTIETSIDKHVTIDGPRSVTTGFFLILFRRDFKYIYARGSMFSNDASFDSAR